MPDITRLLHDIDDGDPQAAAELLPLVYDELKKLAAAKMAAEREDHTLQATALVHEAYLRLVGSSDGSEWNGRGHFFGAAAEAMRRILVESARQRLRLRRGGKLQRVSLELVEPFLQTDPDELLALNEAVQRLAEEHAEIAKLVKLRLFAGLSNHEAASALGLNESTAKKHWLYGRAWLRRAVSPSDPPRNS